MKKSRLWSTDGTDLGIPAFVALSQSFGPGEERILLGMGCHLEARIALQRAFGELNQMMDLAHAGENGELTIKDRDSLEWLRNATAANQPYVMPDPRQTLKRAGDFPPQYSGEFVQDIHHCRNIVERLGMKMLGSTKPARTRACRWSRSWCPACAIFGRALPRDGFLTCRSG